MFISFGHLTKKSLLFLGVPIAMLTRILLVILAGNNNLFYQSFLKCFGRTINGILWFLVERSITNKKENQYNKDTKLVISEINIPSQENPDILNKDELNRKSSIYIQYKSNYYKKMEIEKKNNFKNLIFNICMCLRFCFYYMPNNSIKIRLL